MDNERAVGSFPEFVAWLLYTDETPPSEGWFAGPSASLVGDSALQRQLLYADHLLSGCVNLTSRYSPEQIGCCLRSLLTGRHSVLEKLTFEPSIPFFMRKHCIEAQYHVFSDVFSTQLPATASEQPEFPELELTCGLWWDHAWPIGHEGVAERSAHIGVMERVLTLGHDQCSHAALFGLCLAEATHPRRVHGILTRFVERTPAMSEDLRDSVRGFGIAI